VYVSVLEGGLGGALGVDGGWLPLPTRPQRYCDPASLVLLAHGLFNDFKIEMGTIDWGNKALAS